MGSRAQGLDWGFAAKGLGAQCCGFTVGWGMPSS